MVSAVVIDGVTVGRPCCAVHNCKVPLASNRHRYCPDHFEFELLCSIIGCTSPVVPDKKTCSRKEHQDIERLHCERGQAQFQLKERLKKLQVSHLNDAIAQEVNVSTVTDDGPEQAFRIDQRGNVVADDSPAVGQETQGSHISSQKRVRAQFGRRRTHNEQIIVAPCGMILARETFFGAEAVSSVVVSIVLVWFYLQILKNHQEMVKRTFCIVGQMPNHIFFDNNCNLKRLVKDDPDFANVGLPVDVFHFKCKHSTSDTFCQENCNPMLFPELIGEDGTGWFFNSSIAEQTNVWLVGFHAICREMSAIKYDFFLDEMILRRNQLTKEKLEKEGKRPGNWPIIHVSMNSSM
jgi:hypothetical protein